MSYPPNSAPGGQGAPSFKTNVNRAKTKRWVEAKSYTYDGDDWGEADEYDEYGKQTVGHPLPFAESPNALTSSRWSKIGNTDSGLAQVVTTNPHPLLNRPA